MTNWIKDIALFVWYIAPICRVMLKQNRGRLHYFRNESNDFLRYMQYGLGSEEYLRENSEDEAHGNLLSMLYELNQEIRLRKRQGTWPH